MVDTASIERFSKQIARQFNPERIVLFGSYAVGKPSVDSDVDILVVMPHTGKSWETAAAIRSRIHAGFPLDLIVRTRQQIEERLALGDPFVQEITERGRVLYESDHR